jgi:hypothetical protein
MYSKDKLPPNGWLPFWTKSPILMRWMGTEEYEVKTRDGMILTLSGGWLALDPRGYPYYIPDGDQSTYYDDQVMQNLMVLGMRDELVKEAFHTYGVSKSEIHRRTKLARTTIDRILEKEDDDRPE